VTVAGEEDAQKRFGPVQDRAKSLILVLLE